MPDTELAISQLVLEIKDYRTDFTKARELIAAALSAARAEIDEAFAEGRKSAWSSARVEAMREAAEKVRNMQRHYEQYLQKYPDEQLTAVRAALCESLAKQFDALAAGQGGENG